jgi:1-acyl-sn-glycerol-3-phosphate acyltransferase
MPPAAVSEPQNDPHPGDRKPGNPLLTAYRATVLFGLLGLFWVGTFIFSWTGMPLLLVFVRDRVRRRRIIQRLVSACFRTVHVILDRLSIYRRRWIGQSLPGTPEVIVANHPSFLDFTAIAAACPTICCVVKPVLMRNPLVGWVLRACGHVDGRSLTFAGVEATFRELRERLDEGFPVLIFPEGTRSPTNNLHPFRRGAFTLASVTQMPLRLLVLECDPPALGKGVSIWTYPRVAPMLTIEVKSAIDPRGRTAGAMRDECEKRVRERLAHLRGPRQLGVAST